MPEEKMRTFELGGKRKGVRLDDGTWRALDWLADNRGQKWPELVREWAALADDDNLTRVVRSAVMDALLAETIFNERAGLFETQPVEMQLAGMFDHEGFEETKVLAQSIDFTFDDCGYQISSGLNEFGNVTFYLKSAMTDGVDLIISTPFTRDEWSAKL